VAEEEVTFNIDSISGDLISLQQDFLPFNFKPSDDRRFEASNSDYVKESDDDVQEQLGIVLLGLVYAFIFGWKIRCIIDSDFVLEGVSVYQNSVWFGCARIRCELTFEITHFACLRTLLSPTRSEPRTMSEGLSEGRPLA
jgi:hypothetical protein